MEAYPQKIRELVLGAYEQGVPTAEIARNLQVSRSYARRVKRRLAASDSREAIEQKHGFDPKLGDADRQQLARLVAQTPDSTLSELKQKLSTPVSVSTICRTLIRMKLTLKKSRSTPANKTGRT